MRQSEYQMHHTLSLRRWMHQQQMIVNNKTHHVHKSRLASKKAFGGNVQVRTSVTRGSIVGKDSDDFGVQ